ncbi:hypothetical protein [Oceanobacter mangrovi]|uniref:hypothetical protein n=1 Tax=Oceanobacter mangrovi TaxID=2862510 RepID=UPI001C8D875D|nr:hypothetical protein [Oceanobacter mangrovi]
MNYLKQLTPALCVGALALASLPTQAQLAGKNLILVHGFSPYQIMSDSVSEARVSSDADEYWTDFWGQYGDDRLDWSSKERIEDGIAERAYNKVIDWASSGFCNDGCVIVTHSTGDLVTRYMLENQDIWTAAAGYQPLNILAVFDFAGAGGGSELADLAVDAIDGSGLVSSAVRGMLTLWLGFDPSGAELGVLHDLRPANARNLATAPSAEPRLRFVGGGSEYLGTTDLYIPGTDDGVVSMHSSCGSPSQASYDSCVSYRALDGEATSVSAPASLRYNYYPVLMGDDTHHGGTIGDQTGNTLSYVNASVSVGDGVNVSLQTQTTTSGWWLWKSTYNTVANSADYSMSETLFNAVN